jgi:hypothetical protein
MCAALDITVALRKQLVEYVGLRHRLGEGWFTFADALRGHRQIVIENWLADEDDLWQERLEALDIIAAEEPVDLKGERPSADVAAELAERTRTRRAREIQEHRGTLL